MFGQSAEETEQELYWLAHLLRHHAPKLTTYREIRLITLLSLGLCNKMKELELI